MENSAAKDTQITESDIRKALEEIEATRPNRVSKSLKPPDWILPIVRKARNHSRPTSWDQLARILSNTGEKENFMVSKTTLQKWFEHDGELRNGKR